MQVLTTNLQTNGIIAGLNINWPNSLRSIQSVFNVVQSSMVNTVSMDCSLQYWNSQIMSQAQIQAVIAMLIPIGMLGVFILMWTCRLASFSWVLSCVFLRAVCKNTRKVLHKMVLPAMSWVIIIPSASGVRRFPEKNCFSAGNFDTCFRMYVWHRVVCLLLCLCLTDIICKRK